MEEFYQELKYCHKESDQYKKMQEFGAEPLKDLFENIRQLVNKTKLL